MEIPAVQNLTDATFNPMSSSGKDVPSLSAQSPQPVATGERSASDGSSFGSNDSGAFSSEIGSHLNAKV